MLTSLATIAGALTALIGVGWAIRSAIQDSKRKKWEAEGRSLEQQISEASSNEERTRLIRLLAAHRSK